MTRDPTLIPLEWPAGDTGRVLSRRTFVALGVGALAGPALAACGGPTEVLLTGPRLSAQPGVPTLIPEAGKSNVDVGSGGDAILYVPASYTPDVPAPLFVAMHGAGGNPDNWESYYARAEARGMVFLAPKSNTTTWDLIAYGGFGPDVQRLDRALEHTFARCRIDPARIALAGFSDGASYSLSLGVSNGDLFTHLVAYSPGFVASAPPTVGLPLIYISHGTNDPILPILTTRNSTVPILQDAGYDVTFEEFDGGHEVPAAISESALDWFLA